MKQITDQLVLLLCCFITIRISGGGTQFVVAFLTAVIYLCINLLDRGPLYHLISSAVYLILAVPFSSLLLFCPVILYSMVRHAHKASRNACPGDGFLRYMNYLMYGCLAVICLWHIVPGPPLLSLYLASECLIAAVLALGASSYEDLDERYRRTQDDSTQRNLLLKEKNRALLEKQDYELYTATLKERNRIAREIHDNVGHMLSRSILMTGAIKTTCCDPSLKEQLTLLEDTLSTAMTNVRSSVHDLHDESVNLQEVLESLASTFTFCPVKLDYDMGYDIPGEIRYCFIAIVKEALNNVIRHSNADHVHILLREHPGLWQLAIEDNGSGITFRENSGIGITNMKNRTEALNGTIQIRTDHGFCIFITIPKREES